jgi:hypothetical protein
MSSKELDNLVHAGVLKTEPGEPKEFSGLLDSGRKRLTDAKIGSLSPESRFTLAYDAAHAYSLAALRWHGYRPDKKRFVVFQALQHTIGLKPEFWRVLDKCHQKRNLAEYEGFFEVDSRLLADLLATSDLVRNAVEKLGPIPKIGKKGK